MTQRQEAACLAAVLAASVLLHAATIGRQSLFVDEVSELLHARGPVSEIAWRADSMPPTHSLVVKATVGLLGEGRSVRWSSVLPSLATILVVWRLSRAIGGPAMGVAAAAVFAALPLQLYYAQLIRAYSLTTLAAAIAIHTGLAAMRTDRPADWARFALSAVVGMWVHYYFAIVLVTLFGVLVVRRGARIGWRPLTAAAAIIVGSLPLIPFLQADFAYQRDLRESRPLSLGAAGYTAMSFFSGYSLGPSKAELHTLSTRQAAAEAAPWLIAIGACVAPLTALAWRPLRGSGEAIGMTLLAIAPTPLVGLLGAVTGITYNPRFVAWCVVPIAVLLGAGIAAGLGSAAGPTRRLATAAVVGLAGIAAVAVGQHQIDERYRFEDLAGAAAWLAENGAPGEPVFVVSDYMAPALRWHAETDGHALGPVLGLPKPGERDAVVRDEQRADAAVAAVRERVGDAPFWLVQTRVFHSDPDGLLATRFREEARLEESVRLGGVTIERGHFRGVGD